jgi:hypothetical protein
MVLAGGLFATGQLLTAKLVSEMRPAHLTRAKITTAIAGVLFNMAGAALGGITGVTIALLLYSLVYFLWMFRLAGHGINPT